METVTRAWKLKEPAVRAGLWAGKHREPAVRAGFLFIYFFYFFSFFRLSAVSWGASCNWIISKRGKRGTRLCTGNHEIWHLAWEQRPVSRQSRELFGSEKPIIKLQSAKSLENFETQVPCHKYGKACKKSCDVEKRWKSCIYGYKSCAVDRCFFLSVLCADVPIFFRRRDLGNGLGLETCWSFAFKARPMGKLVCISYLRIEQQL